MYDNYLSILIIENQVRQYKSIFEYLRGDYAVFPPVENEYIEFMDNVRVWINKEYRKRREEAEDYINEYIKKYHIDIIIMDQILGGAHHCMTGIDMARMINGNIEKAMVKRVIFLSKIEFNNKERMHAYSEYDELYPGTSVWIHKGYFGDEILEEKYFKKNVMPEIIKINKSIGEKNQIMRIDDIIIRKQKTENSIGFYAASLNKLKKIKSILITGVIIEECDIDYIEKNDYNFGEKIYDNYLDEILKRIRK